MERIKDALDKARTKRGTPSARAGRIDRVTIERSAVSSRLKDIVYDKTSIVALDEEVLEQNRIVTHTKSDKRGAPFDILRTKVLQNMNRTNAKTLAITSATPTNGKTVISINLAFSIAQNSNNSVLLIDFDLRRPSVGKYLGLDHKPSLYDYLDGKASLPDIMINPGVPRVVIIANDRPVINASETLSSDQVLGLIKDVRNRYPERTIIFDLPPLLGLDDGLVLLPHIDASLLVVGAGDCKAGEVEEALRLLHGHNLIGTALNKSSAKPADYY